MKGELVDATLPLPIDHCERIFIPGHHQLKEVQITGSRGQIHHLSVKASLPADSIDSRDKVEKFQKVGIPGGARVLCDLEVRVFPLFSEANAEAALASLAITRWPESYSVGQSPDGLFRPHTHVC